MEQNSEQPSAVVRAERWGEHHAAFLAAVFEHWRADGAWPEVDDLGRQAIREQRDFDAFALAEQLPRPLGLLERGPEERIILRVRGLSFVPTAWSLLDDFMKVIRLAANLYVEERDKPMLRESHLTETLEFDSGRTAALIELLNIDYWMLGSGGGGPGADWRRELRRSCRHLIDVQTLKDYLRVEGQQLWGQPRATGIPLLEGPIGDELPPDATPARANTSATITTRAPAGNGAPSVFISYTHKDKPLAQALANGLTADGLKVWIDDNELLAGDSIIEQIAKAVADIDFFCALVSESSRESKWCQQELNLAMTHGLGREGATVIPVRVGDVEMPESIVDKLYISLDPDHVGAAVERVARDVRRHRERRELLGDAAATQHETRAGPERAADASDDAHAVTLPSKGTGAPEPPATDEPVRIIGLIKGGVGKPHLGRTRGSGLYTVRLRLNRTPSPQWAQLFTQVWDRPPSFTTMHRPGIAKLGGDTIVLDGTTLEELERYHLETLQLVIAQVNEEMEHIEQERRSREEQEAALQREHEQHISDIASRMKFE